MPKGLKQVADVQHNALLHPYFTLMCRSRATIQVFFPSFAMGSCWLLLSYTSKWSRDVEVHCIGCWQLVSFVFSFFGIPAHTVFYLKNFPLLITHSNDAILLQCISSDLSVGIDYTLSVAKQWYTKHTCNFNNIKHEIKTVVVSRLL